MKGIEMDFKIGIDNGWKYLVSPEYNYAFNLKTGKMMEWGKTKEENPTWCPFGPTILDIEVTTICKGPAGVPCNFCYKSNNQKGHNMSLDTFKGVVDKMPKGKNGAHVLTQVAFGADAQCESNPEIWDMMKYCRSQGLIPNITVADVDNHVARKLVENCGAVAVSAYPHVGFDVCFDTIGKLTYNVLKYKLNTGAFEFEDYCAANRLDHKEIFRNSGMQLNIHYMLSENTADDAIKLMEAVQKDGRLTYVNAIVFLHLKKKGRATTGFDTISDEKYDKIVSYAMANNISIGFDTCGAGKFKGFVEAKMPDKVAVFESCIEDCCAGRLSCYINELGQYYPCSFMEGTDGDWKTGIDLTGKNVDFLSDVWYSEKVKKFGKSALQCGKDKTGCPYWKV